MKLMPIAVPVLAAVFALSCGTADPYRKYPDMVADAAPVSAGAITAQFDKFFSGKLNQVEIETVFHPRLNAVTLEFRYELIRYRQFWDAEGRQQFADALERYKEDYAQRSLINKHNRTRAAYGKAKGKIEWETFRFAKVRVAFPSIELGYRFREEMPFFSTFMRSAREVLDPGDSSTPADSQIINMYFTRAQADELVKIFDQPYLMGLLAPQGGPASPESDEPADDSYREYAAQ